MWREALLPVEWVALRRSAVYGGAGIPRGDGAPVIVVHGFLTRGAYLSTLRDWLERVGYRARVAEIGWNADCLDVLADRLIEMVERVARESGRPVHLVGHSLGGLLARSAAVRAPDRVASVALLGAPLRGLRVHPVLHAAAAVIRAGVHGRRGGSVDEQCLTLACECATVRALAAPLPAHVPQIAIASRGDGLVDWRFCLDPETGRVQEVAASHFGLVLDPTAYAALAHHLARTPAARTSRS
jgi:pimeloyl-ACP methyl ester carboxylesterase